MTDTEAGTPPGLAKQIEWQIGNAYANGHRDGLSCGTEAAGLGFTGCEHLTDGEARSATDPAGLDAALREVEDAARAVAPGPDKDGPAWAAGARWAAKWIADATAARLSVADGPGPRDALREAVGTTDEDSGLEHWHYARGGRTSPGERAGVFVDRQQVLDVIDRVLG